MDWASLYPAYAVKDEEEKGDAESPEQTHSHSVKAISKPVEIADIGCGFGGLLFALAPELSDTLLIGEICPAAHHTLRGPSRSQQPVCMIY